MTRAEFLLPAEERLRAEQCAQEPIHRPGAIQPHGALLVVHPGNLEIVQASANTAQILGVAAQDLLGTSLGVLVGDESGARLRSALGDGDAAINPATVTVGGGRFDVVVHRVDADGVVEFEPSDPGAEEREYVPAVHAAISRMSRAADIADLRHLAARWMRQLVGFDQVMVYHFHPDGHGEVVADDHAPGMTSYLGLHFPATDIPAQARRLYLLKGSGLTADTEYEPAALVPVENPRTGAAMDLSRAELRSVSPVHLQFMRNMGQRASLTLPLVLDGQLLGMITCAHRGPRRIPFRLRRAAEILAQQVTVKLDAMTRTEQFTRQLQARTVRTALAEQMTPDLDVSAGLISGDVAMLDLVSADSASVWVHQHLHSTGRTPTYSQTTALLAALTAAGGGVSPLISEALALDRPDLAALVPSVAGVLVLPFGGSGDCLVWFRQEVAQSVDWLGDQSPDNRRTPLSPRTSFDLWRQTVSGCSLAWDDAEIVEAAELGRDIEQVLLRRAEAELAHLGLHDGLTGLPNRNLLVDRITSAVAKAALHGDEVAILFCDLDDFKRVNDTAGHAAGDAVLIEAAARLQGALRAGDTVARVGGDEFVIVLERARDRASEPAAGSPAGGGGPAPASAPGPGDVRDRAARVAARIQAELTRPVTFQGQQHVISVSVGMTFAAAGSRAEDLLRDADVAMYRAKQSGKNRAATFDDSLRAQAVARAEAEHALRSALVPGGPGTAQLTVAYQPVIDLRDGRLASFEALARLTDTDGRSHDAAVFTSVAEHTGLINILGEKVLESALGALVTWRAGHATATPVTMSVNLSARQAQQADITTLVRAAVERHGLQPGDLTLELTESVLTEAGSVTLQQLTELHSDGVGIAIDDFGTGYASLRYLAILPVDTVKIDQSFTAGLPHDPTSATIVRAVAALAADMNLACIIEGVETEAQLAALPAGVLGQGFLLGRPTPTPQDRWTRPTELSTPA